MEASEGAEEPAEELEEEEEEEESVSASRQRSEGGASRSWLLSSRLVGGFECVVDVADCG